MDTKKLVKTALLAGEIMLISGSEVYRVEETMYHILGLADPAIHTEFALSTGIIITCWEDDSVITMSKRVVERENNLNRIHLVNNISRELVRGQIDLDSAYDMLCDIKNVNQYSKKLKFFAYIIACIAFTVLFGGGFIDSLAAGIVGLALAIVYFLLTKIELNNFCKIMVTTFSLVSVAILLNKYIFTDMVIDLVIIGSIMPLVPGVIFTTAMRDTLNGDYMSGVGRIAEAIVIALAVATGAGLSMCILGGVL